MRVVTATSADAPAIAALRAESHREEGKPAFVLDDFTSELAAWMDAHAGSHRCVLALDGEGGAIGVAWLAIVDRVPRPGAVERRSGDIQSVFVLPSARRRGVGRALMLAVDSIADELRLAHQSVHSSSMGIPLYESGGFVSTPKLMRKPESSAT